MVHGVARQAFDFSVPASQMAARGHRVIAMDYLGRGLSQWAKTTEEYKIESYAKQIASLLHTIGVDRMVWFGVSNGGIIGLHLSSGALKGKILSLVLGDIAPELNPVAIARIRSYTGTTPFFTGLAEAKTFFKATYAQFGYLSEAEWTQLTIRSVRREKKEAEGGGAEVVNGFSPHYDPRIFSRELTVDTSMLPDTLWACLDGCGCPVLLLHGKKSDLITEETVEKMRSKPHVQVVSFDDCGHTPQLNVEHQFKIFEEFVSKVD